MAYNLPVALIFKSLDAKDRKLLAQKPINRGFNAAPTRGDISRLEQRPSSRFYSTALSFCDIGLLLDRVQQEFVSHLRGVFNLANPGHLCQGF